MHSIFKLIKSIDFKIKYLKCNMLKSILLYNIIVSLCTFYLYDAYLWILIFYVSKRIQDFFYEPWFWRHYGTYTVFFYEVIPKTLPSVLLCISSHFLASVGRALYFVFLLFRRNFWIISRFISHSTKHSAFKYRITLPGAPVFGQEKVLWAKLNYSASIIIHYIKCLL